MNAEQNIERIANALQSVAMPDRLWSVGDIAEFTGFHENTAYKLKDHPHFPRPIVIGKHPRWVPKEVKEWLYKQRG